MMRIRPAGLAAVCLALLCPDAAAQPPGLRGEVEAWVDRHQQAVVRELADLLSIPNVAADVDNIRRNAVHLRDMLARRGFAAEILETDGNPLVYGELRVPGATRTLLLYSHYDGQPVEPSLWQQEDPFTPILRDGRLEDGARVLPALRDHERFEPDWRIYARSASDDKSPIVALCAAIDALKASGRTPTSNLRVILDGEEEAGSPNLVPAIARYREKLAADVMLILDGPVHPSGRPTLVFGARGIVPVTLTVYGPKFALHSGHYGNWVPNPAQRLARLLASMKDDEGNVLVDGFYDGIEPLAAEEREVLEAVPDESARLLRLFGVARPERPDRSLQEGLQIPTLNVRGMSSAFVGAAARTVIPDTAIAEIDIRLVVETPADAMAEKLRAHLVRQGYHVVDDDPDDATRTAHPSIVRMQARSGTNAYRTSPLLPISRRLSTALERTFGEPPVRIRTSGGTVPIAPFIEAMGFPAISVPTVNFDNNQHGENENVRLGHFFRGIVTIAAVLSMDGDR
jgi:acetylornithine deacetylase/succinyl-diaminopimelate desuccinylase-like protein